MQFSPRTATILGETGSAIIDFSGDFDTIYVSPLTLYTINGASNAPTTSPILFRAERVMKESNNGRIVQQAWTVSGGLYYYRVKEYDSWSLWKVVTTNMPDFYKDYSTLAALAAAVMSNVEIKQGYVAADESKVITGGVSGILIIGARYNGAGIYNLPYNSFSKIGGADFDAKINRYNYGLELSGECSYFIFNTYRHDE